MEDAPASDFLDGTAQDEPESGKSAVADALSVDSALDGTADRSQGADVEGEALDGGLDADGPADTTIDSPTTDGSYPDASVMDGSTKDGAVESGTVFADKCVTPPIAADAGIGSAKWSSMVGGPVGDPRVAVDGNDHTWLTGYFGGSTTLGSTTLVSAGNWDVFLVELDNGGAPIFTTRYGGTGADVPDEIGASDAGVVISGSFQGTVSFGGPALSGGSLGSFLVGLDTSGATTWSRLFATGSAPLSIAILVDAKGGPMAVGQFSGSVDFGTGALTSAGNWDWFVASFTPTGANLWAERFGGPQLDAAHHVAVDPITGDFVVVGVVSSASVDFGGGPLTSAGGWDAAVARFKSDGTYVWGRLFGGPQDDFADGVAIDSKGNIFVSGGVSNSENVVFGQCSTTTSLGGFLLQLAPDGSIQWMKMLNGNLGTFEDVTVVVDASDNLFFTAGFQGSVDLGGLTLQSPPSSGDALVARFDSNGQVLWGRDISLSGGYAGILSAARRSGVTVGGSFQGKVDLGNGVISNNSGGENLLAAAFDP